MDVQKVIKAANFAAIKHRKQKRKDIGETPYINHPIGVANILTEEGEITDVEIIQAALLHDTVEDTDTCLTEIEDHFGRNVRNMVAEVTDDKSLSREHRKALQVKHAPDYSYEAKLIKMADKLNNLRDLLVNKPVDWDTNRVSEYFLWSYEVTSQMKNTNGLLEEKLREVFALKGMIF